MLAFHIVLFSDTEILKLFLITNTLLTIIITIITLAIPYRTPKVLSLRTPSNLNKSALTSTSISFLVSASIVFLFDSLHFHILLDF